MPNAIGSDVSFYQDDNNTPQGIDFLKMSIQADFTIIRVGQNRWIDPDFKVNWQAAKVAGIPRGSYWFYDSRVSPYDQAELWRDTLDGDLGELPLFPDFEERYGGEFTGWHYWYEFLEHLKDIMPNKEILIYTNYYYWKENAPKEVASLNYFKQYPLWIARYKADEPLVPAPWDDWTFWQYTDKGDGLLWGVESLGIDLNYFNGTAEDFAKRFNLGEEPTEPTEPAEPTEPTEPTEPDGYTGKLLEGMNLRMSPVVSTKNQIGYLFLHTPVSGEMVSEGDNTWLKMDCGSLGFLYVAYIHDGKKYIKLDCDDEQAPSLPTLETKPKAYTLKVPESGTFMRCLFDHETPHWNYKPRSIVLDFKKTPPDNALPGTVVGYGCKPNDFIPLSEEWQWFWYEIFVKANAGHMTSAELMVAWKSLIANSRALTDNHAPENGFIDYVGKQNLGDPYGKGPIQMKCLSMAGNIVKKVGDAGGKVLVEALNPLLPPPNIDDVWEKPWLIQWATQSTVIRWWENWHWVYKNKNFPQIRWNVNGVLEKSGTPFPYIGLNGLNRIEYNRLTPIANGTAYRPTIELREIFDG